MAFRRFTLVLVLCAGCSFSPLTYECTASSQCGANGVCVDGACAFPSASCPSGYHFDSTAQGQAGKCTDTLDLNAEGSDLLTTDGLLPDLHIAGSDAGDMAIAEMSIATDGSTTPDGSAVDGNVDLYTPPDLLPAWSIETIPSSVPLVDSIWGSSATDIYAVGEAGNVIHTDGSGLWTADGTTSTNSLNAVWGVSATEVYVAGNNGVWSGNGNGTWNQESISGVAVVYGLGGDGSGGVYAVGDNASDVGQIFHKPAGGSWTTETPSGPNLPILRVALLVPHSNAAWAFGDSGQKVSTALPSSTTTWATSTAFTANGLLAGWTAPDSGVRFFLGDSAGEVWQWVVPPLSSVVHLSHGTIPGATAISAVTGYNGTYYAATSTDSTSIFSSSGDNNWAAVTLPATSRNFAIWAAPNGELYVGGDKLFHLK